FRKRLDMLAEEKAHQLQDRRFARPGAAREDDAPWPMAFTAVAGFHDVSADQSRARRIMIITSASHCSLVDHVCGSRWRACCTLAASRQTTPPVRTIPRPTSPTVGASRRCSLRQDNRARGSRTVGLPADRSRIAKTLWF